MIEGLGMDHFIPNPSFLGEPLWRSYPSITPSPMVYCVNESSLAWMQI